MVPVRKGPGWVSWTMMRRPCRQRQYQLHWENQITKPIYPQRRLLLLPHFHQPGYPPCYLLIPQLFRRSPTPRHLLMVDMVCHRPARHQVIQNHLTELPWPTSSTQIQQSDFRSFKILKAHQQLVDRHLPRHHGLVARSPSVR